MRNTILCMITLCIAISSFSQSTKSINSGEIIKKGISLHDEGKYKEAITFYLQVPKNDTNYSLALYEASLSYMLDSNYTACKKACEEGLQLEDKSNELSFYINYASVLDDDNQSERALRLYDSALMKYPNAQSVMLNKSVTLLRMERTDEAEALLKKLLIMNPYYSSAHYHLGRIALLKGQMVPAMLSFFTYLIDKPEGTYTSRIIKVLSNISKGTDDVMKLVNDRRQQPTGSFALAERIILSKIALDKNYKLNCSLDDEIIRQLQVMCEKIQYDENSNDFWMQFYVPAFKAIFEKRQFEPTVFYAFSGIELEPIKKYVKSNTKEINKAVETITSILTPLRSTREINFSKRMTTPALFHFSDNVFVAKGTISAKDKLTGKFEFYHSNGNLKSTGRFNDNGAKDGEWKFYYETGELSGIEHWQDGVQSGEEISYLRNGNMREKSNYRDGKMHGEKTNYFAVGTILSKVNYKDGKEDGLAVRYYSDGRKQAEINYANGEMNGAYKSYYKNGQIENEATYLNGKLNGSYKSYHENGQLSFTCNYINGKVDGVVKNFYANGKLQKERAYKEDVQTGTETAYNDEGVIISKVNYDNGKANGLAEYFDEDGKLYSTFLFEKDILKTAKYFNKQGNEISSAQRKSKAIELNMYNAQGFKTCNVIYNDKAEKQGVETFYYTSGTKQEVNNYTNGKLNGLSTGYYRNGAKEYEINYVDGEKDGLAIFYHPNGKIKSRGWYSEGNQNDDWMHYDLKGNGTQKLFYVSNDLHGIQEYFEPDGKLASKDLYYYGWLNSLTFYDTMNNIAHVNNFVKGTGAYKSVYPNGKTRYDGNYVNGELHGPFKIFFFDGSLMVDRKYDRGLLDGPTTEYFFGGKLSVTGQYKTGNREGKWKFYNSDGGYVWKEENYALGEKDGKVTTYYPNGKPETEVEYKNGERHGAFNRFSEDGELMAIYYYKNDIVTSYSYFDKTGKLVPAIPLPSGNGKVISFYKNGNKSSEMEYKDGKLIGDYKLYHTNGKLYYQSFEEFSTSMGKITEYYTTGKIKDERNYYYDQQDGPYKEWNENGTVKEEGNFYLGDLHGTRKIYDANGKLKERQEYYYGTLLSVTK